METNIGMKSAKTGTMRLSSSALRTALLISSDVALEKQLSKELEEKYRLERTETVPHIWADDIEIVFVVFEGDRKATLEQIVNLELLSKGRPIFVLLKQRDVDFLISASHYGARGFIVVPDELPRVLPIIHMQFRRMAGKSGHLTSFFSLKGGVGQTTMAVNVADEIARLTQGKVVLVDLGLPLGDVPLFFDIEPDNYYSLNDFIYNLKRFDEELLFASLIQVPSGLYLLPLPQDPAEMEQIEVDQIKAAIHLLRKYFDHVLVDCAHDFSSNTLAVLDESENLVLVGEPTLPALRATYQAQQLFKKLGYETERMKLVMNRFEDNERVSKVIDQLDIPCVVKVDNDYHGFNEALIQGKTYVECFPEHAITRQIEWMAHMLHYGPPEDDAEMFRQAALMKKKGRLRRWLAGLFPFSGKGKNKSTPAPLRRRAKLITIEDLG